ncbi:MAG: cytochrome c3 family protein [Planctomycetota bacterium]
MSRNRNARLRVLSPGGLGLLFLVLGCSLPFLTSSADSPDRVPFPHQTHMQQGIECGDCHSEDPQTGRPSRTSLSTCAICHEGLEEGAPEGDRVRQLYREGAPNGPFFMPLSSEILFDHQAHAAREEGCGPCHGHLAESDSLGPELRMGMEECMACHDNRGAPRACEACHREIRQDRTPPSHDKTFLRTHGVDLHGAASEQCWLCHKEASCEGCHLQQKPQSHTNQFRRRGHGLLAGMDRRSCSTCHQTDFCVRCHQETEPTSHTASFGSPRNRHCLSCHLPLSSEPACAVCHDSAPSHASAPPKPRNSQHAAATEATCRTCHSVIGLSHPDNGDTCGGCHF